MVVEAKNIPIKQLNNRPSTRRIEERKLNQIALRLSCCIHIESIWSLRPHLLVS
jgi:hypothetical protein